MSSLITNLIWIDFYIDTKENQSILDTISKKFPYLNIIKCKEIKHFLYYILKIQYKIVLVIIAGRYYNDYINSLNANLDKIFCIPISIIFTSDKMEKIFLGKEKSEFPLNLSEQAKKSFNHPFYNPGGIKTLQNDIINFIYDYSNKFPVFNKKINDFNNFNKKNEKDNINNYFIEHNIITDKLILPSLINNLIKNENHKNIKIENDFKILKDLLINYLHDDENIYELFFPLVSIEEIPYKIIIKFIYKAFFYQTKFYKDICDNNNNNNDNNKKLQSIFYNLIYKGFEDNNLKTNFSNNLYKIIKMPLNLYQKYENEFNKHFKIDINSEYDKIFAFIYFDKFEPFYENINCALSFYNEEQIKNDKENVYVLLEIEKTSNKNQLTLNFGSSKIFYLDNRYYLFPFNILIIKNIKNNENFGLKDFSIRKLELNILDNYQSNLRLINFNEKCKVNLFDFEYTKNILNYKIINSFNNQTNEQICNIIEMYNNKNNTHNMGNNEKSLKLYNINFQNPLNQKNDINNNNK